MRIVLGAFAIMVAAFVLWGVGSAMRRIARAPRGRWAVSVGIGMATLVCAGGILNLAHIAYRPVVWALIAAAVVIAFVEAGRIKGASRQSCLPSGMSGRVELILATLVIAASLLFTIATQLPPREFNYHDDLQKYFVHPVRMIETGTIRGGPLSALGSETLGGQAFLHGIVLSFAPLPYINGVDAVFGLFAAMAIAAGAGWRRFGWFPGAALGAGLVAIINPLDANISGLYTGAALIATGVMLVADEREEPNTLLLGLVYSAMIAIKPTFGIFAAFHLAFSAFSFGGQKKSWRAVFSWPARVIGISALGVAPWILTFLPMYLSRGAFAAKPPLFPGASAGIALFSTIDVFDGDSIGSYTAIAAVAAFVAILALIALLPGKKDREQKGRPAGLFAGAGAGVACFLFIVLYVSRWGGYQACVRYAVPFLLGSCVVSALMSPCLLPRLSRTASVLLPAIACMFLFAAFTPAALGRDERAVRYGCILEFAPLATSAPYGPYIQFALSDAAHGQIERYQAGVPAGEPLLAWINTPYWLDFRRNPIVDVDTAGTATPWAHVPANVHYFLWEYSGYAVRTQGDYQMLINDPAIGARERVIAARSLALANLLSELAQHAKVIASDNQFVLFEIPAR